MGTGGFMSFQSHKQRTGGSPIGHHHVPQSIACEIRDKCDMSFG